MIYYSKKIFIILTILLPLLYIKCLFSTKIKVDKQITKKYKYMPGSYKNISILKKLNQKAKNHCRNSFYMEAHYIDKCDKNYDYMEKIYFQQGSSRKEVYDKNILKKIEIYIKDKDIFYVYNVDEDEPQIITKFSEKHNGMYPYMDGYFLNNNNVILSNMKYIDYKGKKVLYSELITYVIKKRFESRYWYDTETGIILKAESKQIEDNKVEVHHCIDYTMNFNYKFDKALFKLNEK
ncbi:hypothetical protein [Clostridium ganghwense]|uniref:Lipoprotein n=1 Tax=Clostridium ganghwense TaxID=312089 RepID=A0ABT4CW25_9CLOT|nr:hypothetical protein [Clostridium ganghwense]MCY6372119.1 hypothetical protein [Clostridium ganghwense]